MNGLAMAVLVGVGGFGGAIARYGVGTRLPGPTATLVVNVLGSSAAGALVAAELSDTAVAITAIGFCGAFTTFSSFAVEVADRLDRGDHAGAVQYAILTLVTALLGVSLGILVVGWV
jgi:CrcB protein